MSEQGGGTSWPRPQFFFILTFVLCVCVFHLCRTKTAFDTKMQKASRSVDLRVAPSLCTMFNVLADARKRCAKLCVLDAGPQVRALPCGLGMPAHRAGIKNIPKQTITESRRRLQRPTSCLLHAHQNAAQPSGFSDNLGQRGSALRDFVPVLLLFSH